VKIGRRGVWRVSVEMLEAYIAQLEREARDRRAAGDGTAPTEA
jgi:hypothetical protein